MATIRSLEQILTWFKSGCYPKEQHFHDTFSSFWHREDRLPVTSIEGLLERLNKKYEKEDAVAIENLLTEARQTINTHGDLIDSLFRGLAEHSTRFDFEEQLASLDLIVHNLQTFASNHESRILALEAAGAIPPKPADPVIFVNPLTLSFGDGGQTV